MQLVYVPLSLELGINNYPWLAFEPAWSLENTPAAQDIDHQSKAVVNF